MVWENLAPILLHIANQVKSSCSLQLINIDGTPGYNRKCALHTVIGLVQLHIFIFLQSRNINLNAQMSTQINI